MTDPLRVVLAGADVTARELRDAGVEVVYLASAAPSVLAHTAVQEDADAVVTTDELLADVRTQLAALDAADIPALTLDQGGPRLLEQLRSNVHRSG